MLIPSPLRVVMLLVLIASSHTHAAESMRTFWAIPKNDGTYGRLFFHFNPKSKLIDGFEAITWKEWAIQQALTPEKVGYIQVMQRPDHSGFVDYYRGASFAYDHPLLLASHKLDFSQSIDIPTIESRWALRSSATNVAAPVFTQRPQVAILPVRALPVPVQFAPLTSQSHSLQDLMLLLAKAAPEKRAPLIALIRQHIPDFIDSVVTTEEVLPTASPTPIAPPSTSPAVVNLPEANSDNAQPILSPSIDTHSLHQQAPLMVEATALENAPATREVEATPPPSSPFKSPRGAWANPLTISAAVVRPSSNEPQPPVKKEESFKQVAAATTAVNIPKQPEVAEQVPVETATKKLNKEAQLEKEDARRRDEQATKRSRLRTRKKRKRSCRSTGTKNS